MNKNLILQGKSTLLIAFFILALFACEDPNSTGLGILPGSDFSTVGQSVLKESIQSYTFRDSTLRTDRLEFNLLGVLNDPYFGKTTADFAIQARLAEFPDFNLSPQVDSLVLNLLYKTVYGDTVTNQSIKVYELKDDLRVDTLEVGGAAMYKYYQDVDLKSLAFPEPIGELDFVPKFQLDSTGTDTVIQTLAIKLDNSLANKLISADSLDMVDNDSFLQYFKGLYVEVQDMNEEGGSLVSINTLAFGSNLTLYYQNTLEGQEEDSLSFIYRINRNSARVSRYEHDYSATDFYPNLDSEVNQDSLIYIQALGGLHSKIKIPGLENWRDSSNIVVNKAELVFTVDTSLSDISHFGIPTSLILGAIDENGNEYYPVDYTTYSDVYGGIYDEENETYSFNITNHFQQIINGDKENYGFTLYPSGRNYLPGRVILKGATSNVGIRFEVTYTKLN